jgi:hypothetical protein
MIPMGIAVGLVFFVNAGGLIMLAIWISAAAVAAKWRPESTEQRSWIATGYEPIEVEASS